MSLAIVRNVLSKVPVPLAGNAVTAVGFAAQKSKAIPRYAPWALPLAAGGAWFIWPAVTDNFKITLGLLPDPELEAAEAAAAEAASAPAAAVAADDDDDDEDDDEAPAAAPKVDMAVVLAKEAKGDFSHLEQKWETDMKEFVNGDDLDDEDDEDDDDEDDE